MTREEEDEKELEAIARATNDSDEEENGATVDGGGSEPKDDNNEDLNLSVERLASSKAFTNKLWNAGKFILQNLPSETDVSSWEALTAYKVCDHLYDVTKIFLLMRGYLCQLYSMRE